MSNAAAINTTLNNTNIVYFNTTAAQSNIMSTFRAKDPISALTHFVGCVLAVIFTPVLLIHGVSHGASVTNLISLSIFMISMILLYGSSAAYHTFKLEGEAALRLKRLDHMMIFILIAGSYTPVCRIVLEEKGDIMLTVVWSIALIGMLFKLLWVTCPKWVSSVIYIAMGWVVIFAMPTLMAVMQSSPLHWLFAGGVIYTIGGVIYALKLISFNSRGSLWGSHEIFHLFVLAGSLCHFICMYMIF